jgi:hypothetical protein
MSLDDALEELAIKAKQRKIKSQIPKAPTAPDPTQPIVKL